jgi:hypothetical protein
MGFSNTESDIVAACLQYLQLRGLFAWRQNQGAIPLPNGGFRRFVGLKGVSDILGILPQDVTVDGQVVRFGNFLAVEVKKPGEKPRREQREFLETVKQLGGIALVVHSVAELEEQLGPFLGFAPPREAA